MFILPPPSPLPLPIQDNNFGLVKQVIKSVVHARIKRLTKVYITLSLEEVAKQAGLPSAQDAVREIIVMVRTCPVNTAVQPSSSFRFSSSC